MVGMIEAAGSERKSMAVEPKTIDVAPEGELARLLDEAGAAPLVLVMQGVRYRVHVTRDEPTSGSPDTDPWVGYDPRRLLEGVRSAAGSISEEEAELWIADIYRWRDEGSRPPDRP